MFRLFRKSKKVEIYFDNCNIFIYNNGKIIFMYFNPDIERINIILDSVKNLFIQLGYKVEMYNIY